MRENSKKYEYYLTQSEEEGRRRERETETDSGRTRTPASVATLRQALSRNPAEYAAAQARGRGATGEGDSRRSCLSRS